MSLKNQTQINLILIRLRELELEVKRLKQAIKQPPLDNYPVLEAPI